ncbi:hypothetical protein A1Q1_03852 [Trichosporon asahii var. asahii CBS 2479]|uniref:ER membrane protein complex subunit 7 beta-sandwich domain-containing protein n=1 Tax=Trichosporon asahii var. asahii (strain ATCC 90039 / CBS 2479 / JCM 2466 / KCTC 7840 / NBRC 103889/ NCYC 2677 / UAMH 7654) TaxID=1186058 RepID=J5ST02_TRIAS|nr:hypothetical protein A1Q1_03852 [Trichosporon asahii var. asahii CBS 2479]EJT47381.1 hypothetical protein A1Q1_03852 [Trichosporon asahii var. asahii CBS 2479]
MGASRLSPGQHVVQAIVPGYDMSGVNEAALKAAKSAEIAQPQETDTKDGEQKKDGEEQPKPKATVHVQTYYPNRQALPTTSGSLAYPLQVTATQKEQYYTSAPSMQILGMLKSPMVLLMIGTTVMAVLLPRITASLENDPEMAKDLAEARKKVNSVISGDAGAQSGPALQADLRLANHLMADSPKPGSPAPGSSGRGGNAGVADLYAS